MARVFIGIGSNVGDRHEYVRLAQRGLGEMPGTRVKALSRIYETQSVGPIPQGEYLNAVAELETPLDPYDLLDGLEAIERETGRVPRDERVKWGPRTLDLDVLLYGNRVISSDELIVPHPLMHERWFVLKPLADIDPAVVHPLLEMTVGQLLIYVEQGEAKQLGQRC